MNKPHKYAEAIKAWADGKAIQCRHISGEWPWDNYVGKCSPEFNSHDIEWRVKPVTRVLWMNIYDDDHIVVHFTKEGADMHNIQRIACIRVEFTEGEGLEGD
jgi:hypothetical protein